MKQPSNGNSCRINLPIDMKVSLLVKTSVGYFKSNEITLKSGKFDDFSGVFVVSDRESEQLELFAEQGGNVSRIFNSGDPITAIVVESFDSELMRIGIENNLPVVGMTWIENFLSSGEMPPFEDHLIK